MRKMSGVREGYDPIQKIHLLVEQMKASCRQLFQPNKFISVDERILRLKGRHHMKQNIPSKSNSYGFKLWALADPDTGYFVDLNVYFGSGAKSQLGLTTDCGILELIDPPTGLKLGSGYQLSVGNYCTSKLLFTKMLHGNETPWMWDH